ncbi:hypothetical protein [Komagataeibacter europaeus]|nr:hypothetical protein [Komagataeibacter europaeus]
MSADSPVALSVMGKSGTFPIAYPFVMLPVWPVLVALSMADTKRAAGGC